MKSIRNHVWLTLLLCLTINVGAEPALAQTIDYDLNKATRTLKSIRSGLDRLQFGDVNGYNRLSKQMNQVATHLEATTSKAHPDFEAAVREWGSLQNDMAAMAQVWQQAQQEAAAQQAQQPAPTPTAPAANTPPPPDTTASKPAPAVAAEPQPQIEPVNLDPLMDKYQRQNLPKLSEQASPEQALEWATAMRHLQTTAMEEDLATIEAAVATGAASEEDGKRVRFWITDSFQRTIQEQVDQHVYAENGVVDSLEYMSDLINDVADGDGNGAYRFAGDDKYQHNVSRLDNAIRAGAVADVFDQVFQTENTKRGTIVQKIKQARQRIDELLPAAQAQANAFANAPQNTVAKTEFLAAIAQKYWLDGDVIAESDDEGGIWIAGDNVGDITHSGEIWVQANERGSIEPNGEVWFDGNEIGSLEDNGEVWRSGIQVGKVDNDGTVWVNGSASGQIEPFQGEWKRAAVLYYFSDYFRP